MKIQYSWRDYAYIGFIMLCIGFVMGSAISLDYKENRVAVAVGVGLVVSIVSMITSVFFFKYLNGDYDPKR